MYKSFSSFFEEKSRTSSRAGILRQFAAVQAPVSYCIRDCGKRLSESVDLRAFGRDNRPRRRAAAPPLQSGPEARAAPAGARGPGFSPTAEWGQKILAFAKKTEYSNGMENLIQTFSWNAGLSTPSQLLEGGLLPALLTGLSAVHRAHWAAYIRRELELPLFLVTADEVSAAALAADLESLLGERPVVIAGRDFSLAGAEGVSRQGERARIAALDAMAGGAALVVCTVAGLLQRTLGPETLRNLSFTLVPGLELAPEAVAQRLLRAGYTRAEQVEAPGQFSLRGGILDFFTPGQDQPLRLEYWGDEIESIHCFDADTQRRTEPLAACRVLPAAEALPEAYPGGAAALAQRLEKLAAGLKSGSDAAKATLREDAARLYTGGMQTADRYLALLYPEFYTVLDYLPEEAVVFLDQPGKCAQRGSDFGKQLAEDCKLLLENGKLLGRLCHFALPFDQAATALEKFPVFLADNFVQGRCPIEPRQLQSLTCKQLPSYGGSPETAADDVQHYLSRSFAVVVLAGDKRRALVLRDFFDQRGISAEVDEALEQLPAKGQCRIAIGRLSAGFEYPEAGLALLTDAQFVRAMGKKSRRKKAADSRRQRLGSCADLSVGDLVVHEYHGIGRFAGIVKMPVDGAEKDYIKISYAGTDSLYVPATQLDLVSKYVGAGEEKPVRLSRMGGADWTRAKTRAKTAAKALAGELVQLYAQRQRAGGHAFAPDSPWQTEFEDRFPYPETDDQLQSIAEIKADMEKPIPMDRLLCGDVGYGKTEVALRAVMKCVLDGKQAAILVPTTVLAQQHYQTAVQRFFGFPVQIQQLSRFRTSAQVKQTMEDLKSGQCDIVIGTHRLLQKDIQFKDLGLLVVDEEQRFGVSHKEHIKAMSRQVDVLTLSATPIPRTLNMALSGIRDMSALEEPPVDRMPVQTFVLEHDWDLICDAIRREVSRGGQVYYLHNRVETIERTASRLARLLENITVSVAHGKMDEASLSAVMESVTAGETQVLVCTTIIETGIDIPNVNTLIIEDADKLGLAQLHQIRGRVGRSMRRASAYLTFRRDKVLTEVAEKRLNAIREFAEFGAGFKIALRDLEIRGAGSLLGAEQSGHMIDVGYDMYLKLLEEAVLEERGEPAPVRAECAADLAVSANIPESYIKSPEQRMDLYRRIAMIRTEAEADDLTDELVDRFGDPPSGVNALIHVALLRGEAGRAGIRDVSQKEGRLRFVLADFEPERVTTLLARPELKGRLKIEPGAKPCLSLKLMTKNRILDEARAFIRAWEEAAAPAVC